MRGTPTRLPNWPQASRPIDLPPSRKSLVSWSLSKDSATAQRARLQQLAPDVFERCLELGFGSSRGRPARRPRRQRRGGGGTSGIGIKRKQAGRVGGIGGAVIGSIRAAAQQLLDAADRVTFL